MLMHRVSQRVLLLLGTVFLFVSSATAQDSLVLPRIEGKITIDGRPTEDTWQDVKPLPVVMHQPTFKGGISEETDIRVAYDDEYLYAAGRFYDSNPQGVRANTLYRDSYKGDDTFAIVVDPFDTNKNALYFFTTPNGVRFDIEVSNDAQDGWGDANFEWNTFWTASATQNDEGWFAEMRIPLSSLGFQAKGGQVDIGLIAFRYIARKNERYVFPAIPPDWSTAFFKPSQARDVLMTDVEVQRPVYLKPYLLGGTEQSSQLDASETAFRQQRNLIREIGADLKYSVASNLTLDLTVNTDFAQVEADPQRVNLTRFPLFFPEKRQFFQERASTFAFSTGGNDRLFNSRRIGLVEGEPVRIWGGARLVGRVDDWDVGVLNMQTAEDVNLGVPSENFGVVRMRRQVLNANSYTGGMVTSRVGMDGSYNVGYGLDGVFRLVGSEYLTVKATQTVDHALVRTDSFEPLDATLGFVRWERRRTEGFHYGGTLTRVGADYRPDVGFITRRDLTKFSGRMAYGHYPGTQSDFTRLTPELSGSVVFRNPDGTIESALLEPKFELAFKSGRSIEADVEVRTEDLRQSLDFPENTTVLPGRYTFGAAGLAYESPQGQLIRADLNMSVGTFFDGWRWETRTNLAWNPSRHVELEGTYEANLVRFPDRDQNFLAHVAQVRTQVALDKQVSTNAFLQYNSAASLATINVRFRYNFGEGNDLWVVYNESFNRNRDRVTPTLPWTDARSLLVKYTYTFRF